MIVVFWKRESSAIKWHIVAIILCFHIYSFCLYLIPSLVLFYVWKSCQFLHACVFWLVIGRFLDGWAICGAADQGHGFSKRDLRPALRRVIVFAMVNLSLSCEKWNWGPHLLPVFQPLSSLRFWFFGFFFCSASAPVLATALCSFLMNSQLPREPKASTSFSPIFSRRKCEKKIENVCSGYWFHGSSNPFHKIQLH